MKNRPFLLLAPCILFLFHSMPRIYSQDVPPEKDGDRYSLEVGNVYFELNADYGAQVSSLKVNNEEFLFPISPPNMGGSTFWHSPQDEWGWPPAPVLDSDPYTGGIENNTIILHSGTESNFDVSFTKTFYASSADTSITIIYNINNTGSNSTTLAPWEVTRVPAEGISLWPMGEGSITGDLAEYTEIISDIAWYGFEVSDIGSRKFFSDGAEGWFAHVDQDSILFVKQFADVAFEEQAPGEGEIELWLTGDHSYIELENQGKYDEIPAEYQSEYLVKWFVRKMPANISLSVGNQELVDYINTLMDVPVTPNPVKPIIPAAFNAPIVADIFLLNGKVLISGLPGGHYKIEIFDITGNMVVTRDFYAKDRYDLYLTNTKPGIYVYKLAGTDYLGTGKLVIK